MPPPLLVDLGDIDLQAVCLTHAQIYDLLPHRHEFSLLGGVCHVDVNTPSIVGFAEIQSSDWWCRGHVPGRVLLPGVLMLEMAAQLTAVLAKTCKSYPGFIGFGGVEQCKFRESVTPPSRLYLLAAGGERSPRRIKTEVQGVVDGRLVFHATITGLPMA